LEGYTLFGHKTRSSCLAKDFSGQKKLRKTQIYINGERAIFQPTSGELTAKRIEKLEEARALLKMGFECVY